MTTEGFALLVAAIAVIAFVYGSVGLGGASSYVAVMALAGFDHREIPLVALGLNLIVASAALLQFTRGGHLRMRTLAPLVVASAPAAYFTAGIPLDRATFQLVLGALLVIAGLRMVTAPWIRPREDRREAGWPVYAAIGAVLGAAAGLTGIGGGVYLAPLLLLTGLATPKEAAAVCSVVVLANSTAGIAGRISSGVAMPWSLFLPLAACVLVAGPLGAWTGARRWRPEVVQAVFGALVLAVAVRLLVAGAAG
jgi:uncharacterized membrane protein YfcA